MNYAVEMGSGVIDLHTKFCKDWLSHAHVDSCDSQPLR
jgi:hypothetical protein